MDVKRILTSRGAKIAYIVCAGLFILMLIMDVAIMPMLVHSRSEMVIPNVVNMTADEAVRILDDAGLHGIVADTIPTAQVKRGCIASQNPPYGSVVREGRNVYLSISGGEGTVETPNLRGRSLRDATLTLEQVGLHPGMVTYEPSNLPPETVISQSIPAGRTTHKNASVDIVISTGEEKNQYSVPSLIGFTLEEAENFMRDMRLRLGAITYKKSPEHKTGRIVEQTPAAGELVDMNTAVNITIAK